MCSKGAWAVAATGGEAIYCTKMFETLPRQSHRTPRWGLPLAIAALAASLGVFANSAEGQDRADSRLLDRPAVPVTVPRDRAEPLADAPKLPPEGTQIRELRARLRLDSSSGWHVLEFQDEAATRQFGAPRVLPCRFLQRMEQLLADDGRDTFLVSGQTTAYRHSTYLLLRNVAVIAPPPASAMSGFPPANDPSAAPQAASPPATQPDPLTAQGVAQRLLGQKPQRRLALPADDRPSDGQAPASPSWLEAPPRGRGNMIVDRLVRVLPDPASDWWEVRFEADNSLDEAPLSVLPGRFLQTAQRLGGKLRATGEMTHYKGHSYILLRKVLPERQLGQF